ncbi:unnamed protein product [Caenorhabditis nigoni]
MFFFLLNYFPCSFNNVNQSDPTRKIKKPDILPKEIAIVTVITEDTKTHEYEVALKSVECYAKVHGYSFLLAKDSEYGCTNKDKFFRRHCVTSKMLSNFSAILFLDADIGVVNPKRKIETFLDENIDITFYDRHFNFEIAMGSYLIFIARKLISSKKIEIDLCQAAYNHSRNFDDLATYEVCVRAILGSQTDIGKVRIMSKVKLNQASQITFLIEFKGTGWVRDAWLTSGVWNPEHDFMLHGWKTKQLIKTPMGRIKVTPMNWSTWYNPFAGPIDLDKCVQG